MRSTVLCCAILAHAASFCAASFCAAQGLEQVIAPAARVHDFGTVARAANTEHRFELFNPFPGEMQIRSVRTSCGCTTAFVETEKIPAGQKGTILARFNTGSHMGQKGATLTVSVAQPIFTELQLNVKGYIRSDVVLSPGEAAFGNTPEGEPRNLELSLNYVGRSDWAITDIVSPLDYVEVAFAEVERTAGRVSYKISVDLDGTAPAGFLQNQLVLHTNDRRLKTLPIRLLGSIEPTLQVSPQSVALGNIKPGEPVQQRLVLKGRAPFRVLDITSEQAEVRFEKDEIPKKAHLINIIVAPHSTGIDGDVEGQLLLKTDLQHEPLKVQMKYKLEDQSPLPPAEAQAST